MLFEAVGLAVLFTVLFGVGRLDGKEGVQHSGDLFRWLIAPLFAALLVASTGLLSAMLFALDAVTGKIAGRPDSPFEAGAARMLSDPLAVALSTAALLTIMFAYDLGYASARVELPGPRALAQAARVLLEGRAEPARPRPGRVAARRPVVRSVGVDEKGRLVVRLG